MITNEILIDSTGRRMNCLNMMAENYSAYSFNSFQTALGSFNSKLI